MPKKVVKENLPKEKSSKAKKQEDEKKQRALVLKSVPKASLVPKKEEGKKTLVEIIEDTKSGVPAQSEVDSKLKR